MKSGLGIDLYFYGYKELVNNLQFNEDIYNLTQINRINLLNLIKQFINEIRESYLKKIKENSNILILANVS